MTTPKEGGQVRKYCNHYVRHFRILIQKIMTYFTPLRTSTCPRTFFG
eukprot:UN18577